MNKTKNTVNDQISSEKQQAIQHLTDLMATIQGYHFKGGLEDSPLRVHESENAAISIDLYHFEGDGKDVVEGLHDLTITYDDGSHDTGWLFCMHYDPDEPATPLQFLFMPNDKEDIDIDPEDVPIDVLKRITGWLEEEMKPRNPEPKPTDVSQARDIIALWSDWCMDYDDENLWLDYMTRHPKAHCNRQHLQEKWDYCYNKYGNKAAMQMLWRELDNDNRAILTEYIMNEWNKKE